MSGTAERTALFPLRAVGAVAAAGFAGTLLRYGLFLAFDGSNGPLASGAASLPWGTFTANILGCLALGTLTGWWETAGRLHASGTGTVRLAVAGGFLGSFTTFSAVAVVLPIATLSGAGDVWLLFLYTMLTALSACAAAGIGLLIGRKIELASRPELARDRKSDGTEGP
ncbi:fluoride efflux transporter FluC [Zhihengliuella halotolerans]|uniref:fluoride efflux transporter FluC n=1 Tax=Zhihengliuella halotolerans TaxID=370736 RepID=UPI000C8097EC|nr:CrcB family protein [Zhihengliuella halotolerans]